jgi:poly-D-alanine transfer protein DltD
MKAVLRGKLIALSASQKELKRAYTSSLKVQLKALEQKESYRSKRSRRQEINSGRNQPSRNIKNYTKNQPNQELVL